MKPEVPGTRGAVRPLVGLVLIAATLAGAGLPVRAIAQAGESRSAIERMLEPGPEARELAQLAGRWDVSMTLRTSPEAAPMVSTGIVAERRIIVGGLFLEEVMKPAPGSGAPDFLRISYLTYNRVEGRWQYVSLDTRFPAGIMPAWGSGKPVDRKLTLQFEPLGFVGFGKEVEGRMVRSSYVVTRISQDHDIAQQYWVQADGTGSEWLAVQYEYVRQATAK